MTMPLLILGFVVASIVAMAVWFFAASSRTNEKRREEMTARRMAQQPWDVDAADGRANR